MAEPKSHGSLHWRILFGLLVATNTNGQALRDAIKRVDPSVVVIKTVEKNILPLPQTMFVS